MKSAFIETGYRPDTEVKAGLDQATFQNPSHKDRIHFYKSELTSIPELQQAIRSTVLVSKESNAPGGSGVIVAYERKKFLITAAHVAGSLLAEKVDSMKYFYRDSSGKLIENTVKKSDLLYNTLTAGDEGLQGSDTAIFSFDGDNEGVEISDLVLAQTSDQVGSAIGFPGKFDDVWKESGMPLISVGNVVTNKTAELTPYMQQLMEKATKDHGLKERKNLTITYTGRTLPGNSGGPLVDNTGKVLGIASGPTGTFGKENGIERYVDFRPILKEVAQRTV